ncbi:MAG TPA: DivIVA domain-containing protein [Acidimicrobiales bacterium]|jgi:DivIVA domain-containing protein|nr:DivIVA domain-containing protein [Acidimicrobiales bacterium]
MGPDSSITPDSIQAQGFTTAFRGYDPTEVKNYLSRVAAELRAWRERADGLESAWHSAEERAARPPVLDEDTLMAAVGEETAAILRTARSAAADMRTKAAEDAARILAEAKQEAEETLASARAEAERLRSESSQAAELLTGAAQTEADRLITEARTTLELAVSEGDAEKERVVARAQEEAAALAARAQAEAEEMRAEADKERRLTIEGANSTRDRILEDLARRRRVATVQIEQLRAGRERLIESYALVRRTLEEVQSELSRADAEARTAADEVGRRLKDEPYVELSESSRSLGEILVVVTPDDITETEPADGAGEPSAGGTPGDEPAISDDRDADAAPGSAGADSAAHDPGAPGGPATGQSADADAADRSAAGESVADSAGVSTGPTSTSPETGTDTAAEASHGDPEDSEAASVEATSTEPAAAAEEGRGATAPAEGSGAAGQEVTREHLSAVDELFARIRATRASVAAVRLERDGEQGGPDGPAPDMTAAEMGELSTELLEAMGPSGAYADLTGGTDTADIDATAPTATAPDPDAAAPDADAPDDAHAAGEPGRSVAGSEAASDPASAGTGHGPDAAFDPASAGTGHGDAGDAGPAPAKAAEPTSRKRGSRKRNRGEEPAPATPAPTIKAPSAVRILQPEAPAEPIDDETLLQAREFAIVDLEVTLTRRLKRALQDEQNDVLDRLRSLKGEPTSARLLPTGEDQVARYAEASRSLLAEAAVAGTQFAGEALGRPDLPEVDVDVADLSNDCGSAIVSVLRRQLEQAISGSGDDQAVLVESMGAAYREWKTQRIERLAGDILSAAFARGTWSATPDGVTFRWLVEDVDGPCPDCDDDALAGGLPKGEAFPTGQHHPPAHSGCRCLLIPTAD